MSYRLTIEPLGQSIEVDEGQTILDASLRAGIYLPHACCHGLCATCKIEVLEGEVDHGEASSFALMDYEREEGRALACCATLQSDVVIEADIEVDPEARNLPVRDFSGVVERIEDLTPTIKGIWIGLDEGQAIDFQAGQYINLKLPRGLGARAFSIASAPGDGRRIELNVRRVPGGAGTAWVHDELRAGEAVAFAGPYGRFFVRKRALQPLLFIAGGSGLSSPRSMILDLLGEGAGRPVTLVHGARDRGELYYHDEFAGLAERHPEFTYLPVLSAEPPDSPWTGLRGYAHEAAGAHFKGDFRGLKAYLCGPPAMVEAAITELMKGRLFERDIHTEKFLAASDTGKIRSPLFKSF